MQPSDRLGLAQLTTMAFQGVDLRPLRAALITETDSTNPGDISANLMDLSVVDQLLGNHDTGLLWQSAALDRQRAYRTNGRNVQTKSRVLVIAEPTDIGTNTPVDFLLDGSDYEVITYYPKFDGSDLALLPSYDIAFCAVASDSSHGVDFRRKVRGLLGNRPVLNLPLIDINLDRDSLPAVFPEVTGLRFAKTLRLARGDILAMSRGIGPVQFDQLPLLIRPTTGHAGKGLEKCDNWAAVRDYLDRHVDPDFFLAEYIPYSSTRDGLFRKYRVVFVNGQPYPVHMAIADHWDIWYLNAGMADCAEKRAEEAVFMDQFSQEFAARHHGALNALAAGIGLDYFGIDCAEDQDGNLVVFEASNSLIVHDMDPDDIYPYKSPHMQRIFTAFQAMLGQK